MGFFLQSLQIAAHNAGYETYIRDAAFLLTVDFMGYDSNDIPTKIENCTRHIPIRIYSAEMTTTAGGSNYLVKLWCGMNWLYRTRLHYLIMI